MQYFKKVILKDGRECIIRSASGEDAKEVMDNFILTHIQTDYLLTYPDECKQDIESERNYLDKKFKSDNEVEIIADIDGFIVGTSGISCIGDKYKLRHRAELGISVDKNYWRLGIGRNLMRGCIECAQKAGYSQIELDVVKDNIAAISLYESEGFVEYGLNPRGFISRTTSYQPLSLMRKELK